MIEVKKLSKTFGSKKAVDNVSFNVKKGDILGFLGPNGAGKSTTMRMLTGYITPTRGDAFIGDFSITKNPIEVKSKIGYLSETSPLYPEMTVNEFLNFCAQIRGFSGKEKDIKRDSAVEKCFLKNVTTQQINTLSKGYRQRVSFAQSILHDPEYLILDEPTDGLDPNQKQEVREMIRSMSEDKAIILSTHILDEAAAICSRAIIISDGKIISDDTPKGLCKKDPDFGAITMETVYQNSNNLPWEILSTMEDIKDINIIKNNEKDKKCELKIYINETISSSVSSTMGLIEEGLSSAGCGIITLSVDQGDLSKVFRMLTCANSN